MQMILILGSLYNTLGGRVAIFHSNVWHSGWI